MTNLKAGQQPPPLRTAARRTSGPGPFQFKFALSEAAVRYSMISSRSALYYFIETRKIVPS